MKVYQLVNFDTQRYAEYGNFQMAKEFAYKQMEKHGHPWAEIEVYEKPSNIMTGKTTYVGAYYVDSDGNVNGLCVNTKGSRWVLTIAEDIIDTIYAYKDIHDIIQSIQFLVNICGECEASLRHITGSDTEYYQVQILQDGLMFSNQNNFRHF